MKASPALTQVVAALIWQDGRLLICQRPAHKARGLLFEFPGGKVEPGESHQDALRRECHEELAVDIQVGALYESVTHHYPDLSVQLFFYRASLKEGQPKSLEHAQLIWCLPEALSTYAFCPADEGLVRRLAAPGAGPFA